MTNSTVKARIAAGAKCSGQTSVIGVVLLCVLALILSGCETDEHYEASRYCQDHYKAESFKVALKNCQKAGANGDVRAQYLAGRIHMSGDTGIKNTDEGVRWLEMAAGNGSGNAQLALGEHFLFDSDAAKAEPARAVKYLRDAESNGSAQAQFLLGYAHMSGLGVNQDLYSSLHWYLRAARYGHSIAKNNAAWMMATATPERIRNGKKALAMAAELVEADPDNITVVDTLAAAQAETGDFESAVETQLRANAMLESSSEGLTEQEIAEFALRLASYQQGKPWRDPLLITATSEAQQ